MKKLFIILATIALMMPLASLASASMVVYDFGIEFSGATPPAGAAPWLRATFDDMGSAGTVRLTMQTIGLVDVEFVSEWMFNFDPDLDISKLNATVNAGLSDTGVNGVTIATDGFKADGDGLYDIHVDFPPPPGDFASKFTTGETVVIDFDDMGLNQIVASSFQFESTPDGGAGVYFSAAHVQGIGLNGDDSGWVAPAVPEPSSLLLVGLGVGVLGLLARRRQQ